MLLLYVARRRMVVNVIVACCQTEGDGECYVIVVCCQTEGDGECYCCMLPDGG